MSIYSDILSEFKTRVEHKKPGADKPLVEEVEELCERAVIRQRQGDLDGAIAYLTGAITLDDEQEDVYYYRGIFSMQANKMKDAIADFSQILQMNPQNVAAYANRGKAFRILGNLGSALNDYSEAIRIKPNSADFYYGRGKVYCRMNNSNSALTDITTALNLELNDESVSYYRKPILDDIDTFADVVNTYNEALRLNPENTNVYITRALVYAAGQRFEEGLSDLETYTRRGDGTEVSHKEAEDFLQSMRQKVFQIKTLSSIGQQKRLIQLLNDEEQVHELRKEKIHQLENALKSESDPDRKPQLEESLEEERKELDRIDTKITATKDSIQDLARKIQEEAKKYDVEPPS